MAFSFGAPNTATTPGGFSFASTATDAKKTVSFAPSVTGGLSAGGSSTGFSFGSNSQPTSTTSTGFGFGNTQSTVTPAASTGFGFASPAASKPLGTSMFGSASPGAGAGAGGSSMFGSSTGTSMFGAAPSSSFGAAQSQQSSITLDTTYESLPANFKNEINEMGKFLKEQKTLEATIKAVSAKKLDDLKQNTDSLKQDVVALRNVQNQQSGAIKTIKTDVKGLVRHGELAGHSVHCLKSKDGLQRQIELPSQYFWELLEKYEKEMMEIQTQIREVEAQLRHVNSTDGSHLSQETPQMLQRILTSQNTAFMQLAGEVATSHERMNGLREKYMSILQREHEAHGGTGQARNPFEAADRIQAEEERRAANKIRLPCQGGTMTGSPIASSPGSTLAPSPNPGSAFGAPQTPSAFGATPTSTFGTFGSSTTPSSTFGAAKPATPGMFGAPASTGNAFGASTPSAFGAPATSTSLFGATPSTPVPSGGGMFGASTPAAAASTPGTSLFGSSTATTPLFGGNQSSSKGRSNRRKLKKK